MRDRQIGTTHSGTDRPISNVLLPVVLAFILLCVVVWWNEISDWPRSLMGSPGTPFNWQEALAETALILIAAIFVISRLLRDNHARDRAQQSLRSLSSRYQAILAAVPDIIMEVDRAKVYTWANQAGLEFFGEDVLGKDAAGYFEGEQDTYDLVQPLFEGSEDVIYVESWQHRRDGETRLLAWWCRALKDADGNPMGAALCTARDITERLRAQQALQEAHDELERSEEQSKAISKGIPVPTYTWRWVGEHQAPYEDLVLVGYNDAAEVSDRGRIADLVGIKASEMYADAPDVREEMSRCFTERTSIQRKILCQRGVAGEDKYLAVKYTFVLPDLVLVHTEDVTERVLAEESLKERTAQIEAVNEELNDFAYVVSHDLKAPLRAVTQVAGWIAQDYSDALGDEGQEMVQLLTGRTKRMHDLIQAILQYSRVGRLREEEKPVDLNQLVQETVEMLAPPEHIRVTVEDELPTVVGEPTRLGQVFQNLVDNAIRFVDKPEGWIRIGCVKQREHWQFSVADNGPGIEEKYHTKIFQPFQTLSRRDDVESTGIGLALVKRAVASWGGDVWVASSVGLGSTFYFTLPKKEEDDEVR